MTRPRILVVGAINRPDIIAMFRDVREACELHFLEYYYNWGIRANPAHYADYGRVHFWHEYGHAGKLLDDIKPARIVSFYLSSLNQVALRAVARDRGIPVFHLEHGFLPRWGEEPPRTSGARFHPV